MDFKEALSILSLIIAFVALWRNQKKDSRDDGAQISEVLVKLEILQSDLKEIKADFKSEVKAIRTDLEVFKDRLVVVEQSTKSAHKRLDELHEVDK